MTNPIHPRDESARIKFNAGEAFKKLATRRGADRADGERAVKMCGPYTPPSNVASSLRTHAPVAKPVRDIEALRRAAFEPGSTPEKPIPRKGRTDDDVLREKAAKRLVEKMKSPEVLAAQANVERMVAAAPDSAWPKWYYGNGEHTSLWRYDNKSHRGHRYDEDGTSDACDVQWSEEDPCPCSRTDALAWLRAHGHKDYADSLEPAAGPVVRAWRGKSGANIWLLAGDKTFLNNRDIGWVESHVRRVTLLDVAPFEYIELSPSDAAALWLDCKGALGI